MNQYTLIQQTAIQEAKCVENLFPYFVRVTDVDDSPDLTDVHPRDRKDMDMYFVPVDNIVFPKTAELIKADSSIRDAYVIAFGPQSQLYPHVDTVELEPYAEIDWLSVYMGMFVPSYDADKVAVKVGETVYDHKDTIVFDTQIPHSAWNWTDSWWVSLRLAVYKTAFA
jgi:aspartyl/asparaginyl beta-hydroxylase (cupin superfamily)